MKMREAPKTRRFFFSSDDKFIYAVVVCSIVLVISLLAYRAIKDWQHFSGAAEENSAEQLEKTKAESAMLVNPAKQSSNLPSPISIREPKPDIVMRSPAREVKYESWTRSESPSAAVFGQPAEILAYARSLDYNYHGSDVENRVLPITRERSKMLRAYLAYLDAIPEGEYSHEVMDVAWQTSRHCTVWSAGPGEEEWLLENIKVLSRFLRHCPKNDERYIAALSRHAYSCASEGQRLLGAFSLLNILNVNRSELHPEAVGYWNRSFRPRAKESFVIWCAGSRRRLDIISLRFFHRLVKDQELKIAIEDEIQTIRALNSNDSELDAPQILYEAEMLSARDDKDAYVKLERLATTLQRMIQAQSITQELDLGVDLNKLKLERRK